MRIGLIIADFESSYSTSFQHTARVKYDITFDTSNVDSLGSKLTDLKKKVQLKQHKDVHVGLEITLEHVTHVENLLNQILEKYKEVFGVLPSNRKIYTINQKLRESESPSAKDLAKEVLTEILTPEKPVNLTKSQRIKADAKVVSTKRALAMIKKTVLKANEEINNQYFAVKIQC